MYSYGVSKLSELSKLKIQIRINHLRSVMTFKSCSHHNIFILHNTEEEFIFHVKSLGTVPLAYFKDRGISLWTTLIITEAIYSELEKCQN